MATNLRNAQWDDDNPIIEAKLISRMRAKRNKLLAKSDWTQTPDVPQETIWKWKTYRQDLRDIPQKQTDPTNITWPTKPS